MEIFGQQVVGADYLGQVTGFPGVKLKEAFLRAPGDDHILELLEYVSHLGEPTPRETNRPGNGHFCFVVDDLDAAYDYLTQRGA
jgi:hypothetical protein